MYDIVVTVSDVSSLRSFVIGDAIALYSRGIQEPHQGDLHQGLRIDSVGGTTTLVEFRVTAIPEILDCLAQTER